jgi:hypothetical protein
MPAATPNKEAVKEYRLESAWGGKGRVSGEGQFCGGGVEAQLTLELWITESWTRGEI